MWWVIENLLNGHFASRQKPFCFFFKNSIKVFNKVRLNLHVLFVQNLCSTKNVVFLEYSYLNHVFPTCYEVLTQPVFFIGRYSAYPGGIQCCTHCTVYGSILYSVQYSMLPYVYSFKAAPPCGSSGFWCGSRSSKMRAHIFAPYNL